MRKALAFTVIAVVVILGQTAAWAALVVPTPTNGSTVSGTVSLKDDGASSGGVNLLVTSCNGSTAVAVTNSANATVASVSVNGTGGQSPGPAATLSWVTDNFPNGAYHIIGTDKKTNCFTTTTTTATNNVTVNNIGGLAYGGDTAKPTGASATVKATFTDQNGVAPPAGQSVTFALSGGGSVTTPTVAGGVAQTTLPITGAPRAATLTVSYAGTYFATPNTTVPFTVQADPTTTVLTSSQNPSTYGQSVSFSAAVSATVGGTPTGAVQFSVDGTNLGGPVNLDGSGHATSPTTSTLTGGPHSVLAAYAHTGNFADSSNGLTQTVNKAATTTSVVSSANPSAFGQPVTFTATVLKVGTGTGAPTGTVTFQQNGQPIGGAVTLQPGGTATSAPIAVLGVAGSPYTITATYQGDGNFSGSSITASQAVGKASTAIAVGSSANPSVSGQAVTFSATVSSVAPGAGTPPGTATFTVDGNPLGGAVTLSGSGQATSDAIASLTPGDHMVSIAYSGSPNFATSTTTYTQHVDQAQTTTALTSSNNPSVFGQPVTFKAVVAVVSPGSGTPTGTVTFTVDGTPLGSPVALDGTGSATSDAIASLVVADHTVVATYNGSTNFLTSAQTITQTVHKAATSSTLTSSVSPSVYGQNVTFTAGVSVTAPGAGSPTGTVSFFDGATLLATVPLVPASGTGQATFSTPALTVGTHAVTAVYSGDDSFLGSTGATTQAVNKASSTTTVTQNGPSVQGQPVTFTASVAYVAPGAGLPTGTVQFKLNGASQGAPVPLDGSATAVSAPISGLTPGSYLITAVYSGDGNLLPSSGSIGQAVQAADTTTSLVTTANPSAYGTAVTLTATVAIPPPAVGTPSGTVDFYDGAVLLGTGDLSSGPGAPQATLTVPVFAVGHHALTAQYLGEADFNGSTSSVVDQVVQVDPTTVAVTATPNPSVFNSSVVLKATVSRTIANPNNPTGTVSFFDGATLLGTTPVATAAGATTGTITVPNFVAGSHPIKATYTGDAVFGGSTSSIVTLTVNKAATALTATKDVSAVITAVLTTAGHPLAGQTLVFKTGTTTICTLTTDANGTAVCNGGAVSLQIGLNGYTVTYATTPNYLGSTFSGH